jgi:hypothetical protein
MLGMISRLDFELSNRALASAEVRTSILDPYCYESRTSFHDQVFKDRGGWILGETRVSRPRIAWLFAAVRVVTLAFRLRVPLFAGFLVAGDAGYRGLFSPRQVSFFVSQFLFSAIRAGEESVSFETGSFASLLRRAGRGVYTRLRSSVNLFRLVVRRCRLGGDRGCDREAGFYRTPPEPSNAFHTNRIASCGSLKLQGILSLRRLP